MCPWGRKKRRENLQLKKCLRNMTTCSMKKNQKEYYKKKRKLNIKIKIK